MRDNRSTNCNAIVTAGKGRRNGPGYEKAETAAIISTDAGRVRVRIIHTDEELMITRSVCRILGNGTMNKRIEL